MLDFIYHAYASQFHVMELRETTVLQIYQWIDSFEPFNFKLSTKEKMFEVSQLEM